MKKQPMLCIGLLLFYVLCTTETHAQDHLFCDDSNFDTTFNSSWLDQVQFQTTRNQVTPQDIASILVEVGALGLLQADMYKRTHPTSTRSLLDYPIHVPMKYSSSTWTTDVTFFYNHTDRVFFTRTSDAIASYFGLCDPKLLEFLSNEVLQEIIKEALPNFKLDPLDVLPLFKNMTTQKRRLGIMFSGMKRCDNRGRFRFMLPLYYLESNFWLTEDEQRAVEVRFGRDPNQNEFAEQYMISDKIGVGDLRFSYDFPVIDRSFFHVRAGVLTTIPLSFPFKRGIKGSKFSKLGIQSPFNMTQLFCAAQGSPAEQEQAMQQGQCFFLRALRHLSSNLIEIPLGNGRHLGIGGYIRYKSYLRNFIQRRWAENVVFNSHVSLELLMPARHKRFYIEQSDQEEFDALGLNKSTEDITDKIGDDPAYAQQVLSFFEKQMTEKFFPFALNTLVWPGCIFKWTTKACYEGKRWGVQAGFDTWVHAKENLSRICIPQSIPQDINTKIARRPLAYQWKLFGSIFLKKRHNENNWLLSLTGDYTIANTGIGSDYTFAFVVERHF